MKGTGYYRSQEGRKKLGTPEFDATVCDVLIMCGPNSGLLGKTAVPASLWGGPRDSDQWRKVLQSHHSLASSVPPLSGRAHAWIRLTVGVSPWLSLPPCSFLLFFLLGLFVGTWPGHVQTQTIQQCWRVDSIYLNNGSLFSLLFNPQFR